MIVTLNGDYRSYLLLQPVRNGCEALKGVEIIANFSHINSNIRIPTELVLKHINARERLTLFHEKLALLENIHHFFIERQCRCWIAVDEDVVSAILSDRQLASRLSQFPFLSLTISEHHSELNQGKANISLKALAQRYPLILADFGAGVATTRAITDGLFRGVMLDKMFVQRLVGQSTFEPFMRAIVSQLSPYCSAMMIAGIDSDLVRFQVKSLGFDAMQGALWSAVEPSEQDMLR